MIFCGERYKNCCEQVNPVKKQIIAITYLIVLPQIIKNCVIYLIFLNMQFLFGLQFFFIFRNISFLFGDEVNWLLALPSKFYVITITVRYFLSQVMFKKWIIIVASKL